MSRPPESQSPDPVRPEPPDTSVPLPGSPYDPAYLALHLSQHPAYAVTLLAALTPEQRVMQALAQAAWLAASGDAASMDDILAHFDDLEQRWAA
jgi:hypothetical protein